MNVQIVYFEGCPNADAARAAVRRCLEAEGLPVAFEEIDTESPDAPAELRQWGSPTILVDGVDVGGEPAPMGTSCRLYDNPDNRGVPSDAAITAALHGKISRSETPADVCCDDGSSTNPATENARGRDDGGSSKLSRASLTAAVIAAVAASACCLGPVILALIGVSGVGLAATIEPYRPIFLGVTAVLLAVGFYLVYRRPRAAATAATAASVDPDNCECDAPGAKRSGKLMLWVATTLAALFAVYPYIAGATATTEATGSAEATAESREVTLRVEGMTCAGCATNITNKLAATPGVVRAKVSYDDKTAIVLYDPALITADGLARAVTELEGYRAKVPQ